MPFVCKQRMLLLLRPLTTCRSFVRQPSKQARAICAAHQLNVAAPACKLVAISSGSSLCVKRVCARNSGATTHKSKLRCSSLVRSNPARAEGVPHLRLP
jgi:hypothetical protein